MGRARKRVGRASEGGLGRPERIQTLHPEGKQGVRIERKRYEAMRAALLAALGRGRTGRTFTELTRAAAPRLARAGWPSDASVTWHAVVVKQDLEARGVIERVPSTRPVRLRRAR